MMYFLKKYLLTSKVLTAFTMFYFLAAFVYAQSNANSQLGSAPLKKQVINFEDELIEGSAQKPELFYLLQKKNFNYKRLIRLRENFLPEIKRTSEDIRRLRGGN